MAEGDLPAVLQIQTQTGFQHWSLQQFQQELGLDYSLDFVLTSATIIQGFAIWHWLGDEAELCAIAIDPSVQKTGLGSFMLRSMHQHLRQRGAKRFFLEVRASNVAAQALYTKMGYQSVGVRRKYYADGENAVLMSCGEGG